jgi:hypothetical protein
MQTEPVRLHRGALVSSASLIFMLPGAGRLKCSRASGRDQSPKLARPTIIVRTRIQRNNVPAKCGSGARRIGVSREHIHPGDPLPRQWVFRSIYEYKQMLYVRRTSLLTKGTTFRKMTKEHPEQRYRWLGISLRTPTIETPRYNSLKSFSNSAGNIHGP